MINISDTINRVQRLQSELDLSEALFIQSDLNRLYLTGFSSSAGAVIITKNSAFFFTDSRYIESAKNSIKSCEVCIADKSYAQHADSIAKDLNINAIRIEAEHTTVSRLKELEKAIECQIISDGNLDKKLSAMRQIKSPYEIEQIITAQQITDAAFEHILKFIRVGKTEREIALELEHFMRLNGADGIAFDTIAVSGENSSKPHGVPTDRKLKNGDFLTMDFGARYKGYCSDMTRTIAIGEISVEQRYVYDTVLLSQRTALSKLSAGMKCSDADAAARDIIKQNGYGENFGHSLGHSLGLYIHEDPNLSPKSEDILSPGMVTTVEPGIYLEGKFGVRIEDMVLICEDGVKNLTKSPKMLIKL